jgi:hypothetical protein
MSIGTQKHTPERISNWLRGHDWDYPQDDWYAGRLQGWLITIMGGVQRATCLREGTKAYGTYLFNSDKEALDWVVSRAISGNALAIKALCYLSHHNPNEYGHWGKLLKGMYGNEEKS